MEILQIDDEDSDFDSCPPPNTILKHFFEHLLTQGYKANFRSEKYRKFVDLMDRLPKVYKVIKSLLNHKKNRKQVLYSIINFYSLGECVIDRPSKIT